MHSCALTTNLTTPNLMATALLIGEGMELNKWERVGLGLSSEQVFVRELMELQMSMLSQITFYKTIGFTTFPAGMVNIANHGLTALRAGCLICISIE